jgi:hypothetical protein
MKRILFASLFALFAVDLSQAKDLPPYQPLTDETAARYFLFAAMSSSAYEQADRHFDLESLGWRKLDWKTGARIPKSHHSYVAMNLFGLGSGLAFDIWEKDGANEIVFAFRGTDKPEDWLKANIAIGFSVAYKSAKKKVREFIERNAGKRVVAFTGHSLGGGLSLSCSCDQGIPAIVFDSSPRVFDGLGDHQKPASRISIHQRGEVLETARRASTKFPEVIDAMYETNFDFGPNVSNHSGFHLALNIVKQAAKVNQDAKKLLGP